MHLTPIISKNSILKKYKGYYFLNIKYNYNQDKWVTRSLAYQNGRLFIKDISSKESLEKLRTITESKEDTNTIFRPTKKFKQFIKQDGLQEEEQFIKINMVRSKPKKH